MKNTDRPTSSPLNSIYLSSPIGNDDSFLDFLRRNRFQLCCSHCGEPMVKEDLSPATVEDFEKSYGELFRWVRPYCSKFGCAVTETMSVVLPALKKLTDSPL